MKKKVLIIGNTAKEYALAKKLSFNNDVFVAPGNDTIKEFAECVDIRENSSQELLEFVLENGVDLTIPVSEQSLKTDIVELFNKNDMRIFAPNSEIAELLTDKNLSKKMMYKLGIPTPKFGIFEKYSVALDYIKGLKNPFVLKNNTPSSAVIFTSLQNSKSVLESMFSEKHSRVLVEDYIYGTPFGFYAITDGYKALPIGSSILYKHSLEGEGGQLTSGMGACSPNYKLSSKNEEFLMNNVIYPTLDYLEINYSPYVGILGVNGIISEDGNIKILGFQTFMQDADCAGIIELINTDLLYLFEECIIGAFSDEVNYIEQKDLAAATVVLLCRNTNDNENVIYGLDKLDENTIVTYNQNVNKNRYLELEAKRNAAVIITTLGRTSNSAIKKVYEEINSINFDGLKYRHDIGISSNIDYSPIII